MLLSWLSKLLASLLVSLLFAGVVGLTLSQTLLSSKYVEGQLQHANAYPRLSDAISGQIAKDAGDTGLTSAQLTMVARTVITPAVVQQKISSTLDQLEAHYKGNGPVPTVDVSGLVAQAESLGLPAPKDSNLTQPIQIKPAVDAKKLNDKLNGAKIGAVVLVLLLVAGLVVIAIKRHDYKPLANVAISLGTFVGLMGAVLAFATGLIDRQIKLDYSSNAFAGVAHDLAKNIAHDIGMRLLITGITLLVIGIVARLLLRRFVRPLSPPPTADVPIAPAPLSTIAA